MSRGTPSLGRPILQGDITYMGSKPSDDRLAAPSDASPDIGVPEISFTERGDRKDRIAALLAEMSLQIGAFSERVMSNMLKLEDTFITSLEELMDAVPYENEVDSSRRLLTGLVGSADQSEVKRKLGASTVMYGRKDHSRLLLLVQGLNKALPEKSDAPVIVGGTILIEDLDD